ncbi:MAG: UvrB/UvrC motif-containing protein, partial [Bdellovibrionota bacterium]
TPTTVRKAVRGPILEEVPEEGKIVGRIGRSGAARGGGDTAQQARRALNTGAGSGHGRSLWSAAEAMAGLDRLDPDECLRQIEEAAGDYFTSHGAIGKSLARMEADMRELAKGLEFEKAARLRDRVRRLKALQLGL